MAQRLLFSSVLLIVTLDVGCADRSRLAGAPLGQPPESFEKWCRDRQMTVSSSSEPRLFLRGERRTFREIHCSGGVGDVLGADGFALDAVLYSVTVKTADTAQQESTSVAADTMTIDTRKGGERTLTDYRLLVEKDLLAKESALWEMGPALQRGGSPLPPFFGEPLRTLGNVALGMSPSAFRSALKDLGVACDEPPKRGQIGGRAPDFQSDSLKKIEAARGLPTQEVVSCNGLNNVALFSNERLFYFRSEIRTSKKRDDDANLQMLHRVAGRAISPLVVNTSTEKRTAGAALYGDSAREFGDSRAVFFTADTALVQMQDDKETTVLVGDLAAARQLCLRQLYEARLGLGEPHPTCGEAGVLLALYPCPVGSSLDASPLLSGGLFVYEEHCKTPTGERAPPTRTWLANEGTSRLAREQLGGDATARCFDVARREVSCSIVDAEIASHPPRVVSGSYALTFGGAGAPYERLSLTQDGTSLTGKLAHVEGHEIFVSGRVEGDRMQLACDKVGALSCELVGVWKADTFTGQILYTPFRGMQVVGSAPVQITRSQTTGGP